MKQVILVLMTTMLAACAPLSTQQATATAEPVNIPTLPTVAEGERGPVYVSQADLVIMESYPVQVSLHIVGDLPTPCHRFHAEVSKPDSENRIQVAIYSVANTELMCAEVLAHFEENVAIPMNGQAEGTYSVWLNGELVGEFSYPA
jgi:hypothetical protein